MKTKSTKQNSELSLKKKVIKNYSKSKMIDTFSNTCPMGITNSSIMQ